MVTKFKKSDFPPPSIIFTQTPYYNLRYVSLIFTSIDIPRIKNIFIINPITVLLDVFSSIFCRVFLFKCCNKLHP